MIYDILVGGQRVRVNTALSYESATKLDAGQLVVVPLREKTHLGVVVRQSTNFNKKAKSIKQVLPYKLSTTQRQLMQWIDSYYPAPLSSIAQLFLPNIAITTVAESDDYVRSQPGILGLPKLTKKQIQAVNHILGSSQTNYILHGVTGSGKTRVYAELIKESLDSGKSALVLTPEIGLTTPIMEYFENIFGKERVICFHSQLTAGARAKAWSQIAKAKSPLIIVGPRSALFLPLKKLGLIVVDEFHDSAYKQEQQPFYNATRVAAKLAKLCEAKCILGSATPPVGDYYSFVNKKLPIIEMSDTAIHSSFTREDFVIDIKDRQLFTRSALLSTPLVNAMDQALKHGEQSLLFLNRRGSARTILCKDCGWQSLCPRCDISLTYHADKNRVLCHVCAYNQQVPLSCPECHGHDIVFQTPGTKSIESEVGRLFPDAKVGRYDKDSAAGTKLHQSFQDIQAGKIDILVGTQLLSKGLDLPKLTVIGIVQADSSMALPDFSATERTFQQLSQVAGRLGRGHGNGKLFVQTFKPDRALLRWALEQDYKSFYKNELEERLAYNFPPAVYLLVIQAKRKSQAGAIKAIEKLRETVITNNKVSVGDPAPCFHEKRAEHYYWQIVIRSKERSQLIEVANRLPSQTIFNIDPTDLL